MRGFVSSRRGEPNIDVLLTKGGAQHWKKLYDRYNPRTPSRALHAMMGVMRSKEITDVRKIERVMDEWEMKLGVSKRDFGGGVFGVDEVGDICRNDAGGYSGRGISGDGVYEAGL